MNDAQKVYDATTKWIKSNLEDDEELRECFAAQGIVDKGLQEKCMHEMALAALRSLKIFEDMKQSKGYEFAAKFAKQETEKIRSKLFASQD